MEVLCKKVVEICFETEKKKKCTQPFHCRDCSWKVVETSVVSMGDGFSPTVVLVLWLVPLLST